MLSTKDRMTRDKSRIALLFVLSRLTKHDPPIFGHPFSQIIYRDLNGIMLSSTTLILCYILPSKQYLDAGMRSAQLVLRMRIVGHRGGLQPSPFDVEVTQSGNPSGIWNFSMG